MKPEAPWTPTIRSYNDLTYFQSEDNHLADTQSSTFDESVHDSSNWDSVFDEFSNNEGPKDLLVLFRQMIGEEFALGEDSKTTADNDPITKESNLRGYLVYQENDCSDSLPSVCHTM
jgi:hypothetical protein